MVERGYLKEGADMNFKRFFPALFLLFFMAYPLSVFSQRGNFETPAQSVPYERKMSYSEFLKALRLGKIREVTVIGSLEEGGMMRGSHRGLGRFYVWFPADEGLKRDLKRAGIKVWSKENSDTSEFMEILIGGAIILAIAGFVWYQTSPYKQRRDLEESPFARSQARYSGEYNAPKTRLSDVVGIPEVVEDLKEIVQLLKNPTRHKELNARIPKGILFVGPPGTGKTLIARAIAGEAKVPFFSVSGSEFVEMFVGVGASRVRDLFRQAKGYPVAVIFIDEIDAVGRARRSTGSGSGEGENTLNQLLVEMNGMESDETIILVLAATNRLDILDPALLRPGRFDRQLYIPLPTHLGRVEIFDLYLFKKEYVTEKVVDPDYFARKTSGFSGAGIKNVVNEAALLAGRDNSKMICQKHVEASLEKILSGTHRKSFQASMEERPVVALREAAYALVSTLVENHDPLHKVSILFRGSRWGNTSWVPSGDVFLESYASLADKTVVYLAGYVAEKFFYRSQMTTGTQQELKKATILVEKMAMEWGLFPHVGTISYKEEADTHDRFSLFRKEKYRAKAVDRRVDVSVKEFVHLCEKRAARLVVLHSAALLRIKNALLEHEELNQEEVFALIRGPALLEYKGTI